MRLSLLLVVPAALVPFSVAAGQTFSGIGALPGGVSSEANAVSADGTVVVGYSETSTVARAVRWTAGQGLQALTGGPGGYVAGSANGVSADGSVIAGDGLQSATMWRPFRWTAAGGVQYGSNGSILDANCTGLSADGGALIGWLGSYTSRYAMRWEGTVPYGLGQFPGGSNSTAMSANTDGSTVVGYADLSNGAIHAFRWTVAQGLQDLGALGAPDAGASSYAMALNADGSTAVGYSELVSFGVYHACRWTAAGIQDLGTLPGLNNAYATAISADGSMVGGYCLGDDLSNTPAFLWTRALGMVDLGAYLRSRGLTIPTGWLLQAVSGFSADGQVIVGTVRHDGHLEGFVASLRGPCGSADFNHDTDTGTDLDIEAFFACLAGNCCPTCGSADFDGDGGIGTDADIEAFFRVLAGGSC